jgi:hypothetical protein
MTESNHETSERESGIVENRSDPITGLDGIWGGE